MAQNGGLRETASVVSKGGSVPNCRNWRRFDSRYNASITGVVRLLKSALAISIVLYIASLKFDAFCVASLSNCYPGWQALILGPVALVFEPAEASVAWFANLLLIPTWLVMVVGDRRLTLGLGIAALTVASTFMLVKTFVDNEGAVANPIVRLGAGYWLWLGSIAVCIIATISARSHRRGISQNVCASDSKTDMQNS